MNPIRRLLSALLVAVAAPAAVMLRIPAGDYAPPLRAAGEPERTAVAAFRLDERAVTNADFLAFVTAQPKWRRSQVSPLFTDEAYLQHWAGDLELGPLAPPCAPVVRVSWFAARAFARWAGKRLPTTAEWELAASAGFTRPDGKNDPELARAVREWLSRPVPAILPDARAARPDYNGVRGLHGLVWEWVEDFSTAMVTGESRADSGLNRDLFCGAGAVSSRDPSDYAAFMRLALRSSLTARHTTTALGFRCAQDLPLP
ncbi:MAG: Serine/threonine-protein kinase pkn1 [Verrucomicrobiota bacterium]|jgi:formylglycine-generating enzyme required for sulfatase activity